jgi:PadR family transcriptional regulator, regulatory protein AphA
MARSASAPASAPRLTTTSYAILGLLRLQPFSAYELTGYMRRSALSRLWPRTEASLYREPKTLVAHGLARARVKHTGRRERTVYEITAAGRRAFEAWLREPGDGLRIECEAALKAFFGDATDLESLRGHLESLREPWLAWNEGIEEGTTNWLAGRLPFPDRIQYHVLAADLFDRLYQATEEWAADWLERTESWEETGLHDHSEQQARALIEERRARARHPALRTSGRDDGDR